MLFCPLADRTMKETAVNRGKDDFISVGTVHEARTCRPVRHCAIAITPRVHFNATRGIAEEQPVFLRVYFARENGYGQ